jgi:preprotein translocase subunit SecA
MATISYQNYFRIYKKLAGMTGADTGRRSSTRSTNWT